MKFFSYPHRPLFLFAMLSLLLAVSSVIQAQTSSFSYQGKLDDAGSPANGAYDFEFRLFDALSGGAQIGSTITVNDLTVTAGIFNTSLDFGASAFPGANRWLEISVRLGTSTGAYTTLTPRQPINSTPYSIKSLSATTANGLSAACVNCVTSGQINNINSTQINGTITGSQLALPLSLTVASSNPVVSATNNGTGTGLYGNSTTATGTGVYGQNSSNAGNAVYGAATNPTGTPIGVHGVSNASEGTGVRGLATSTSPVGNSAGVQGTTNSTTASGFGVFGSHAGTGAGVYGESPGGFGVRGHSTNPTGVTYGVAGTAISSSGIGVRGSVFTTTGSSVGVSGESRGDTGIGVRGEAGNASGINFGVYGISQSTSGINASGVYGESKSSFGNGLFGYASSSTGEGYGVLGQTVSTSGIGVFGKATSATGVNYGVAGLSVSSSGAGVYGSVSANGNSVISPTSGVYGDVSGVFRVGVRARNSATSGFSDALLATAASPDGAAIYAINDATSGFDLAGEFIGNVGISGNLSKSSGTFKIDHPLDPENKYLYHSFVESPEMMNIYNGVATLDERGETEVLLPDWFESLNKDFRYQLTCIGGFAPVFIAQKVQGNRFRIAGGQAGMEVSWQVTGVRQDAYANKHRIRVEEDKPAAERGTYLHPDVFGQPEEKGVSWARNPGLMRELKESRERSLRGEPEPKSALPTARRGNQ